MRSNYVEWVAVCTFLLDLTLRLIVYQERFFVVTEPAGPVNDERKKWQMFNIADFAIVLVWASLFFAQKISKVSSGHADLIIFLRMMRAFRSANILSRVLRSITQAAINSDEDNKSA